MALEAGSINVQPPPAYADLPKQLRTSGTVGEPTVAVHLPTYAERLTISRPVSHPSLQPETASHQSRLPSDYRKWGYVSLCLFMPSGIAALICSIKARKCSSMGSYDEARKWSQWTLVSNMISTIIGLPALFSALTMTIIYTL